MFNVVSGRLQLKVTLLVFGILLVFGTAGSAILLYLERQATVSHFEESTITLASVLADTIERDMLLGDRDHIQQSAMLLASKSPVNGVTVISGDSRVYASSDPTSVGQQMASELVARALSSDRVDAPQSRYARGNLYVTFPVSNKPECHVCHGSETGILGAIEIARGTDSLDAQSKEQSLIMVVMAGLTFVSVGTMLAIMLRSAVLTPLSKLAASARKIAEGDLTSRVQFARQDEVGTMARTFNEMAERVEQHARALQERTLQLHQMAVIRGQLLERLTSAQEEERRRLARELHDEVGQAISSIMLDLAMAMDGLPSDALEAKERLSQSRALAAQTLTELRKLIYDLRPEVLDQLGLVPAIRSYAKSHLEARNIKAHLSFRGLKDRLPPSTETTVFRVIQEAITNIIRHSSAGAVNTQVVLRDSRVTAVVEDDGIGFDVEAALKATGSWGLRGIRERVAAVGGTLEVQSQPGQGTRLRFEIPLEEEGYG